MRRLLCYVGVATLAGLFGCGSKAADPAAPSDAVVCAPSNYDIDTYSADMLKMGDNSAVSFQLLKSDMAPPQLGTNTWTMKIAKAGGAPLGGDITAHASMPLHSHPAQAQPLVTFDSASGTYTITPVYLFMVGYWRVELSAFDGPVDANATPIDVVDFNFCVD